MKTAFFVIYHLLVIPIWSNRKKYLKLFQENYKEKEELTHQIQIYYFILREYFCGFCKGKTQKWLKKRTER